MESTHTHVKFNFNDKYALSEQASLFVAIRNAYLILLYLHPCAKFSTLFSWFIPAVSEVVKQNTLFHHCKKYESVSHFSLLHLKVPKMEERIVKESLEDFPGSAIKRYKSDNN